RGSSFGGYPNRPYYPNDSGYYTQPPRYPPPIQPPYGSPSTYGRLQFNHQGYYAQNYPLQSYPGPPDNWFSQYSVPLSNQGFQQSTSNQRMNTQSISYDRKNKLSVWKEKCSRDPWENVKPVPVPSGGDRLVTSAVTLRHTDLLASDYHKRSLS
ncbi:unnamed protein product, partial [Hymenolepis diminuta]